MIGSCRTHQGTSRRNSVCRWAGLGAFLALAGCARTPLEPTIVAAPGPGRSFASFQQDWGTCKDTAAQRVAARTGRLAMQRQYDTAFGQCMYARGDQVAGYPAVILYMPPEPARRHLARKPSPELVRDIQGELLRLDYLQSAPDGSLGPKTRSAIRQFERGHGMAPTATVSKSLLDRLLATPSSAATPAVAAGTEAAHP